MRTILGATGLIVLALAALLPSLARPHANYLIGSKTFTEQYVLAALIEERLQAAGLTAARRPGLGSNVLFDALAASEVDVAVDYSGTLWANRLQRKDDPSREQLLTELSRWLQTTHGIRMLGSLGFENAYALAMTRKKAQALGIRSIANLATHAGELTIAGDYEFFARPEWVALRDAYGLRFRAERQMQPEFMYKAVADGEVDVIAAYTSDGQIATYDLAVLMTTSMPSRPMTRFCCSRRNAPAMKSLSTALQPLVGVIDVATMRTANARASNGKETADAVARWLNGEIAKRR